MYMYIQNYLRLQVPENLFLQYCLISAETGQNEFSKNTLARLHLWKPCSKLILSKTEMLFENCRRFPLNNLFYGEHQNISFQ